MIINLMDQLHNLFDQKMDRKEFLIYLGLILLAITGISGFLKNLKNISSPKAEKGFGAKPYGS